MSSFVVHKTYRFCILNICILFTSVFYFFGVFALFFTCKIFYFCLAEFFVFDFASYITIVFVSLNFFIRTVVSDVKLFVTGNPTTSYVTSIVIAATHCYYSLWIKLITCSSLTQTCLTTFYRVFTNFFSSFSDCKSGFFFVILSVSILPTWKNDSHLYQQILSAKLSVTYNSYLIWSFLNRSSLVQHLTAIRNLTSAAWILSI